MKFAVRVGRGKQTSFTSLLTLEIPLTPLIKGGKKFRRPLKRQSRQHESAVPAQPQTHWRKGWQ